MINIEFAVAGWSIYDLFQKRSWSTVPRVGELVIAQLYVFCDPSSLENYEKVLKAAPELSGEVCYLSWDGKENPTVLIYLKFSKDTTNKLVILSDRLDEARKMKNNVLYNQLVREFERVEK